MDGHPLRSVLVQLLGVSLVVLATADVFMTVLFARAGTGPISRPFACAGWAVVRRIARVTPRWKDGVLAFFGPVYLVLLIAIWVGLLILGFALFAWPALGSAVRAVNGPTSTDFVSALYYAGGTLTTAGSPDLRPMGPVSKFMAVLDSALGISVLTLALTYIIQLYTALQRRNALVLGLHHASGGTGDAAALLSGLGPRDDFTHAESQLAGLAAEATGVYESHHFYSVLVYFRFHEPHYALARSMLTIMEMLALIDTALSEERHGWLRRSASITQLREGGMHTLNELAGVYLPGGPPPLAEQSEAVNEQWRRRYHAAVEHLRRSGISITPDRTRGAERYVELRQQWDAYIMAFARYMEHSEQEIDPWGVDPAETARHREMPTPPLRAAS